MSIRVLIIFGIIIIILAVVAFGMGTTRKPRDKENETVKKQPPSIALILDRAFSWMAPTLDLSTLTITGATLQERQLTLQKDQKVTIKIAADPDAGAQDCRNITFVVKSPGINGVSPALVHLTNITLKPPLPKDFEAPDTGQILPNSRLEPDPITNKIDAKRMKECAIPVFKSGGTIVLEAQHACVIEIK